MEDQGQQQEAKSSSRHGPEKSEAVRSRWTPKPEQILILESIFNSGMVNPPKDETVRIRKLLQKFGAVGDANVFYWFQNRRSRSRRRQRQMMQQAAVAATATATTTTTNAQPQLQTQTPVQVLGGGGAIPHDHHHTPVNLVATESAITSTVGFCSSTPCYDLLGSSSSSSGGGGGMVGGAGQPGMDVFFSVSSQMGFPEMIDHTSPASSILFPPPDPNLSYHPGYGDTSISGFITVFINGIATEVPKGPIDIKSVFGEDVMLIHSSGVPIPTNEFGFLMHTLQHGESYFLVSKPTQV